MKGKTRHYEDAYPHFCLLAENGISVFSAIVESFVRAWAAVAKSQETPFSQILFITHIKK